LLLATATKTLPRPIGRQQAPHLPWYYWSDAHRIADILPQVLLAHAVTLYHNRHWLPSTLICGECTRIAPVGEMPTKLTRCPVFAFESSAWRHPVLLVGNRIRPALLSHENRNLRVHIIIPRARYRNSRPTAHTPIWGCLEDGQSHVPSGHSSTLYPSAPGTSSHVTVTASLSALTSLCMDVRYACLRIAVRWPVSTIAYVGAGSRVAPDGRVRKGP
jgi:hypothetical protein